MQHHSARTSRILPADGKTCAAAALALLLAAPWVAVADDSSPTNPDGIKPPLAETRPYGKTYDEWSAKWWQWTMAFPSTADPASNTAPPDSAQSGKVWLLATAHGSVTVPPMDFSLQQNPDPITTNWTAVTTLPVLNLTNLQNQVTVSAINRANFYRLKH